MRRDIRRIASATWWTGWIRAISARRWPLGAFGLADAGERFLDFGLLGIERERKFERFGPPARRLTQLGLPDGVSS